MKRWKRPPHPGSWTKALLAIAAVGALALCGPPAGSAWATAYGITGGSGAAGGDDGTPGSGTGFAGTPAAQGGTGSGSNQSGQAEETDSPMHWYSLTSATEAGDALSITGGSGGDGGFAGGTGPGFGGGRGAGLTITPWAPVLDTVYVGSIALAGGAAGAGGAGHTAGTHTAGDGGSAGYATLDFRTINVNVSNNVDLTATGGGEAGDTFVSGSKGGNGGNGGNVTLNAGSLIGGGSFTLTTGNNGPAGAAYPESGGLGGIVTVAIFAPDAAAGGSGEDGIMRFAGPITVNARDGAASVTVLGSPNDAAAAVGTGGKGEISADRITITAASDSLGNVLFTATGGATATTTGTAGVAGKGLIKADDGISVTIGGGVATDPPNNPSAKTVTITAQGGASSLAGGAGGDGVIDAGSGALDIKSLGSHADFEVTAGGGTAYGDSGAGGNALIRGNEISIVSSGSIGSSIAVAATGGWWGGANSAGGSAEVVSALADGSKYADLTLATEAGSGSPVSLAVVAGSGHGTGSGGDATVRAADITVSTSTGSGGSASLHVAGGEGGGSTGGGGKAVIDASGTLHVTALNAVARVSLSGGGGLSAPGDAEIHVAGMEIKSGQGAADGIRDGEATVIVNGNDGGNAKVASSGDVLVQVVSGTGSAAAANLMIQGGDNQGIPGRNGGGASLEAAGIQVTGTLATGGYPNATVLVLGGNGSNNNQQEAAEGGSATVTATGAIEVTGAGAAARFQVEGGNSFGYGAAGSATVAAAGVTIESGASDASLLVMAGGAGSDAGTGAAATLTSAGAGAGGAAANVTVNAKGAGAASL
ncbi:MAG: hypothetical protein LBU23_06040, partial [Planctomycetota bacterium]|nr:hypothetical protein [Planctomycetota bacterium]